MNRKIIILIMGFFILLLNNAAIVSGQALLVNFGSNSGTNVYNTAQFSGWNNVTISSTTSYTAGSGVAGTTMLTVPTDSNQFSNFTCISGNARQFNYGERIILTWHNNTGADVTFNPLISFIDSDNPVNSPAEPQWFILGKLADYYFLDGDTIQTIYDITNATTCGPMIPASEGTWSRINVCANTIQSGIILDKIKIGQADTVAPGIPTNLTVVSSDENSASLSWDPVTDNSGGDGLFHYEIWENGQAFGLSDSASFTAYLLESGHNWHFSVRSVDNAGNKSGFSNIVTPSTSSFVPSSGILNPYTDLQYMGAFLLPTGGTGSDFGYMDTDLAFYQNGDPGNTDAWPGSLFLAGNATQRFVSEINIPVPVISAGHNVNDLNHAGFLQDFTDIRSPNQPVVLYSWSRGPALEYLPAQTGQTEGYLYTCFGDYYQWNGERLKSFGASRIDFSSPSPQGGWYLGSETPFSIPYYMTTITFNFSLPSAINGHLLVAGGSRPGDVHHGPTLMAYSPWNDGTPLPADNSHLSYTPLLMYDADAGTNRLNGYSYCDMWTGGAWATAGAEQAVVISGVKGRGLEWYGYDNGESTFNVMFNVPTPTEPEDHAPRQSHFDPMILFYDPADLLQVAAGTMQTYEPQPIAVLFVNQYLFYPNTNGPTYGQKFKGPGGMAFDRQHGLLYMIEQNATGIDTSEAIIHVWKINPLGAIKENVTPESFNVYSDGHIITVRCTESADAKIELFNLDGQLMYSGQMKNETQYSFSVNTATAICLIRITSQEKVQVNKLLLR
jgi:hypothetical protein